MRNIILTIVVCLFGTLTSFAQMDTSEKNLNINKKNVYFIAHADTTDIDLGELLKKKTESIIGRTGCGGEDSEYLIVPSIEVGTLEKSSGMIRNVTIVKGTLTLKAVSKKNQDIIWHSATIPLEATITGESADPAIALANQIKVTDAVYVRFVRVASRKISESLSKNTVQP